MVKKCSHKNITYGETSDSYPKQRVCTCDCGYTFIQVKCTPSGVVITNAFFEKIADDANNGVEHYMELTWEHYA